ncbi:MAG: hypothetical protein Q4F97_02885 [Bacteroidales bacterium]|nr:hypothetical protein [Bacteroidales bacterium]
MYRHLFLLLIISFISADVFSQIKAKEYYNNNGFKPDLKGPVKSQTLTVMTPSLYVGTLKMPEQAYILKEKYNENQIRTKEEIFNLEKVLIGKSEILQDRNGFAVEILYTDIFDNLLNRITYEYDKDGSWKRVVNYDVYYNPLEIIYYEYTDTKKISQIRKTDEEGNILEREIFLYDERDNNSERTLYDSLWSVVSTTEYLYDKNKNMISYRTLSPNGETVEFYEATYVNDSIPASSDIEYYKDGKVAMSDEYVYDPLGNVLKITKTNFMTTPSTKETTEYLYEWDLWGNWTKQIISSDGKASVIASREIDYY